MTQNDHSDVYIIPPNFVRDGTLFSGRAEARNVVEAAFLALVGIRFLVFLNLGIKGKIYVGIILILPLVILAVIGVQGESLSSFLIQLFSYMVKRRVLTAPSGQYRLKRNSRIRKQKKSGSCGGCCGSCSGCSGCGSVHYDTAPKAHKA